MGANRMSFSSCLLLYTERSDGYAGFLNLV